MKGPYNVTVRSFAQNFEDVLLWRALGAESNGTYVDVGAGHPEHHSVTKLFYDAGWSGVNIEPIPDHADALAAQRPRDITIHAVVSTSKSKTVDLTIVDDWDELSTTDSRRTAALNAQGRHVSKLRVPVVRLDAILRENAIADVHFLKIDVEGAELDVLRTLDFSATRPWVIVVEAVSGSDMSGDREAIGDLLTKNSYAHVYFDGLNDFFVANEHGERLRSSFEIPVNVTDDFVRVSDGDTVMVELIGRKVGLLPPVSGPEVAERVEALGRDRVRFEAKAQVLEAQCQAAEKELKVAQHDAADARKSQESLRLTVEALEQTSFERERLVAWYAQELSAAKARVRDYDTLATEYGALASRVQVQHDALAAVAVAASVSPEKVNYARAGERFAFVFWRLGLPFRVLRRPRFYLRLLLKR